MARRLLGRANRAHLRTAALVRTHVRSFEARTHKLEHVVYRHLARRRVEQRHRAFRLVHPGCERRERLVPEPSAEVGIVAKRSRVCEAKVWQAIGTAHKESMLLRHGDELWRMTHIWRVRVERPDHKLVAEARDLVFRHLHSSPLVACVRFKIPSLIPIGEHVYLRAKVSALSDNLCEIVECLAGSSAVPRNKPRQVEFPHSLPVCLWIDIKHLFARMASNSP